MKPITLYDANNITPDHAFRDYIEQTMRRVRFREFAFLNVRNLVQKIRLYQPVLEVIRVRLHSYNKTGDWSVTP